MTRCRLAWVSVIAAFASACAAIPLTSVNYPRRADERARCLMVFLPGAGDVGRAFEAEGFVQLVRDSGLSVDLVAADATFAYYGKKAAFDRIRLDVVQPARAKGYAQTWVAGISMGGMGALLFARKEPELVDGVVAFAPYLGDLDLQREIEASGGLVWWSPPAGALHNYQRDLWRWLKELSDGSRRRPSLYLAYGEQDGMSPAHRALEQALPQNRVFHAPGGHEWPVWRALFARFLKDSDFARKCGPAPAEPLPPVGLAPQSGRGG